LIAITRKAPRIPLAAICAPRTFIHVEHLVDGMVVAAGHPAVSQRTFVIADDIDTSVAEISSIAVRVFGREPWRLVALPESLLRKLSFLAGQQNRIDKLLGSLRVDNSGFRNLTGWRPAQSTSEAITSTLKDWPNVFKP
jgi:nucleoside-diphosphate-sugar epimerase